jgi:hypothetical protein
MPQAVHRSSSNSQYGETGDACGEKAVDGEPDKATNKVIDK